MPSLPGRVCSTPGCGKLRTIGSLCEGCERTRQTLIDSYRRGSTTERGYDTDHRRMRILAFQRDSWRCVDCGWQPQIIVDSEQYELGDPPLEEVLGFLRQAFNRGDRHLHGDHVIPIENRPDLRLDLDNYATRCNLCHSAKTMRELKGCTMP
jgi:hypothetical protein